MLPIADLRAFYLDPANIRLRADALLDPTPEASRVWLRASREFRNGAVEVPVSPQAPAVVWSCVPPELQGTTIRVDQVVGLYATWNRTVVVEGVRFRTGSGRRVNGRATRHGRLDYARTYAAFWTWQIECRQIEAAHQAALDAIHAAHESALLALLTTMSPTRRLRAGCDEVTAVSIAVHDFGDRDERGMPRLIPGYLLFSRTGRISVGGARPAHEIDRLYVPVA